MTLKSRLRIIQGHCKWNYWTDHTRISSNRVIWRWILSWPWLWVRGQSRSLKVVPFESLGTLSYSPFIVTIAVSLAILEIFSVKEWPDLKSGFVVVQSHWKLAQFDRPCITFYWPTIVTIALSCTIFKLFDVEHYRDLQIWVRSHSRSLKIAPFDRP